LAQVAVHRLRDARRSRRSAFARPGQRYVSARHQGRPDEGLRAASAAHGLERALPITRTIEISEGISVKELAEKLEIRAKDLITRL